MRSLEHILRSETENLQDLTDSAVQQTEELWSEVESTFKDLEDKGREFLKHSSTVCVSIYYENFFHIVVIMDDLVFIVCQTILGFVVKCRIFDPEDDYLSLTGSSSPNSGKT